MKYVILEEEVTPGVQRLHPIFFPEYMTHSYAALGYVAAFNQVEKRMLTVRSAGFGHFDGGEFKVTRHGSESLGIKPSIGQSADDDYYLSRSEVFNGLVY